MDGVGSDNCGDRQFLWQYYKAERLFSETMGADYLQRDQGTETGLGARAATGKVFTTQESSPF